MMKRACLLLVLSAGVFALGPASSVLAQEDVYELAHEEVFGKLERAPVTFDHTVHMEELDVQGCGACHHVYDEEAGELTYEEGEEAGCTDCHGVKKEDRMPALRQAYHGNCTVCHRKMIKEGGKSGPTMCGGCHKKK